MRSTTLKKVKSSVSVTSQIELFNTGLGANFAPMSIWSGKLTLSHEVETSTRGTTAAGARRQFARGTFGAGAISKKAFAVASRFICSLIIVIRTARPPRHLNCFLPLNKYYMLKSIGAAIAAGALAIASQAIAATTMLSSWYGPGFHGRLHC